MMKAILLKIKDKAQWYLTRGQRQKAQKAAREKNAVKYINRTSKITGWDIEYTREKMAKAKARTGCSPKEYVMYKFYERTEEEQDTFYLVAHQQPLHKKYAAGRRFVKMIRDKEKTNNFFSEYIRRPWCVNTNVTLDEFREVFRNTSKIIYKPIDGHCGYGIEKFEIDSENIAAVYEKLASYAKGVVEEYITQHPLMSSLSPSSVNSLRFVTISSKRFFRRSEWKTLDVVYSIVRIGQGNSIVDNLHSGGMVANVDLDTGILVTYGANHKNQLFVKHPDTGVVIKGFEVPYFKEALEMVKEAIEKKQVQGYLGWDIAISENGPMLLEVNNRPGADGLQTAYAQEGIGMKHVMEKYM